MKTKSTPTLVLSLTDFELWEFAGYNIIENTVYNPQMRKVGYVEDSFIFILEE